MPKLSESVLGVDAGLPPGERYIVLSEGLFDGGTGEGDFVNGNGPDTIPVRSVLGRRAGFVDIELTEGNGGAGASYSVTLLPNPTYNVYAVNPRRYRNPMGEINPHLDQAVEVQNQQRTRVVVAREGETVRMTLELRNVSSLQVDGTSNGGGSLGGLLLTIR